MKTKLLCKILALLGFTGMASCDAIDIGGVAEYGTPNSTFSIKGKVTDEKNNPLKDIRVVVGSDDLYNLVDTVYTDNTGHYDMLIAWVFPGEGRLELRAADIDGVAGGGKFVETVKTVDVTKDDYKEPSGSWYDGKVSIEEDLVMIEERAEE